MKSSLNRNLSEGNIHNIDNNKYLNIIKRKKIQKFNPLSIDTVATLQNSIHEISRKIEEDKINLHILQERHFKRQTEYNKLAGKPEIKTKDQILQEIKIKIQKYKNRQIFEPNYGKKEHIMLPDEETFKIKKNSHKCQTELDFLKDEINKEKYLNDILSNEIREVKKDKLRLSEKYEKIEEKNKEMERTLRDIQFRNKKIYNKIHFKDLNAVKSEGKILETQFLESRDKLEYKYHKVIEANIKREKDHKNELKQIRLKNAIFADKARLKKMNHSLTTNSIKIENNYEIHDRMPILDTLINKWKYITKYKKNMLEKYIKHANQIRISFEKLLEYLGLEKYESLPEIFSKDQKQMTSVETYLNKISTEVDLLKEEKNNLEKKIILLKRTKREDKEEQNNLVEDRKEKIEILKKNNNRIEEYMNKKRNIFKEIQEPTFDFLRKMQQTYLTDFVVSKNNVDSNSKLNETNVINYLETVYCYCKLIKDFDENSKSSTNDSKISKESKDINKNIDLLKKDFKAKLSKINYNHCVNSSVQYSISSVVKKGNDFDETIKRLANEIVNQVTKDSSFANTSSMNTNNASN
jgi:hypothetical protein